MHESYLPTLQVGNYPVLVDFLLLGKLVLLPVRNRNLFTMTSVMDDEYDIEVVLQSECFRAEPGIKVRPFNPLLRTFNKQGKKSTTHGEIYQEIKSQTGQKRYRDPSQISSDIIDLNSQYTIMNDARSQVSPNPACSDIGIANSARPSIAILVECLRGASTSTGT